MKVFLLHRDRDFEPKPELHDEIFDAMVSGNLHGITSVRLARERRKEAASAAAPTTDDALVQDLELVTLWFAMAARDEFLFETAKRVTLTPLRDPDEVTHRQQVLADCLEQTETVREIYALATEALASDRRLGGFWPGSSSGSILYWGLQGLHHSVELLKQLRQIGEQRSEHFQSPGFGRFFAMLQEELADDYLATVERQLRDLELRHGLLESARLGQGDKGIDYVVHRPPADSGWRDRLPLIGSRQPSYHFDIHPRDEAGARALEDIRSRGLNHVADAVAQSAEHVKSFFIMLRLELSFYLACVNLHAVLKGKGEPTCFPKPAPEDQLALTAHGIYDVCLALHLGERVVGNDLDGDGKSLVMITGANQGGKSTLLRGLGLAHVMMQSGMFVGAESFRASTCAAVFTHYKREEDATMESGKLDEELRRMSAIADEVTPRSLLLCNESFASTNEREGSEIARQVIRAMLDKQTRVLFVTHMYDLAHGFYAQGLDTALFLRAERSPDGTRTFKLLEGEPLPTSYGEDSFRRIFGEVARTP